MTDSVQDAVAAAKAKLHGQQPEGLTRGPASAAPLVGKELNPSSDNPSPPPNPGAGEPAAPVTHMSPTAAQAAQILDKKVEGGKTYHNQHPGSTYISKKGEVLSFDAKGELTTNDPDVIKELDAISDKPGCPVWTKGYVPGQNEGAPQEEIKRRAAETVADLKAQASRIVR